jgi:hypothetical protein
MADQNTFVTTPHKQARPAFNAWFGVMPEISPAPRQTIAATF